MDDGNPLRVLSEGRPGVGRTTVTRRLISLLRDAGVPLGGFVTDEIRVRGCRESFTDALKRRSDVGVLQVTEQTRDALPKRLAAQLGLLSVQGLRSPPP